MDLTGQNLPGIILNLYCRTGNPNNPGKGHQNLMDPRIRAVTVQQIFPSKTTDFGLAQLVTFDMAYYPTEKGPYNFDVNPSAYSSGLDANGKLRIQKRDGVVSCVGSTR